MSDGPNDALFLFECLMVIFCAAALEELDRRFSMMKRMRAAFSRLRHGLLYRFSSSYRRDIFIQRLTEDGFRERNVRKLANQATLCDDCREAFWAAPSPDPSDLPDEAYDPDDFKDRP